MVGHSYVRSMIHVRTIDVGKGATAGVTQVDTSVLAWPGLTFSPASSAGVEQVSESYKMLAAHLSVAPHQILGVRQTHSDLIHVATANDLPWESPDGDALITDVPGVFVGVKIADCCGVLLNAFDDGVVAAVHSGWRGTAQQISRKTIDVMRTKFDVDPATIRVGLSPCASGAHYEVGKDVYERLSEYCTPHPEVEGKWFYDNHAAIVSELLDAGVRSKHIAVDDTCAMVDTRFHSHRRDGQQAGRNLAFIGMQIA